MPILDNASPSQSVQTPCSCRTHEAIQSIYRTVLLAKSACTGTPHMYHAAQSNTLIHIAIQHGNGGAAIKYLETSQSGTRAFLKECRHFLLSLPMTRHPEPRRPH